MTFSFKPGYGSNNINTKQSVTSWVSTSGVAAAIISTTNAALGDFFELVSPKAAKVVNQVVSDFAPFTCFDLTKPGMSQQRLLNPDRPKFVSVCGGQYA